MSATTERVLAVLLALYVAGSTAVTVVLPWLNELLHPATTGDKIAALGVFVGLVTVALVGIQIQLARQQNRLQNRQLDIIDRQDKILNRVEDLYLHSPLIQYLWDGVPATRDIPLEITNHGKGIHGVHVHVYLEEVEGQPNLSLMQHEGWIQGESEYIVGPETRYTLTHYSKWFDILIPGDGQTTVLPPLLVALPADGEYAVRWRVQSLNGKFPKPPAKFGRIELNVFQK